MKNTISAIDNFIRSRTYNYALMINGKWGCGKTNFAKNNLIPHLENDVNKEVYYISLYGIKSSEEISQILFSQAVLKKIGMSGEQTDAKIGRLMGSIAVGAVVGAATSQNIKTNSIEEALRKLPKYNDAVIIFDDLERCMYGISDVLGYINSFVEHTNAYIIIIANEEEIGKYQLEINSELQLMVALNNAIRIEHDEETENQRQIGLLRNFSNEIESDGYSFSPEELEHRRQLIFKNNKIYNRIKEKVVGQTIQFEPDLKEVYKSIINVNIKENSCLCNKLSILLDEIVDIAEMESCNNIRVFQFFLEKVSVIFESIGDEYETIHSHIIKYTLWVCIRYMQGKKLPNWNVGKGEYGLVTCNEDSISPEVLYGFKFINRLITDSSYDSQYVHSVLSACVNNENKRGKLKNDPSQLIRSWYYASDAELSEWLNVIEMKIRDGEYSTAIFTGILGKMAELYSHDVAVNQCEKIIDAMIYHIDNADPKNIESLEEEYFSLQGKGRKKYVEWMDIIEEKIKKAKNISDKEMFKKVIKDNDKWATTLLLMMNDRERTVGHSFIYWLEPEEVSKKIEASTNQELYIFRNALDMCYSEKVFYEKRSDDIPHLIQLYDYLYNKVEFVEGELRRVHYEWLKNDIDRYIKRYSEEGDNQTNE